MTQSHSSRYQTAHRHAWRDQYALKLFGPQLVCASVAICMELPGYVDLLHGHSRASLSIRQNDVNPQDTTFGHHLMTILGCRAGVHDVR